MGKKPNNILLWLRIIRPQTLFASLCPVLIGLLVVGQSTLHEIIPDEGIVPHDGRINTLIAITTIVCALALQILSNLINDLYDYYRGTDKQGRQGFKRALAEGEVNEKQVRRACMIALGVALLTGLVLVVEGGWVILGIGLSAILFAWLYTATNHSLSYLGIADIFVYLYYGVIATMGTIWLQMPYNGPITTDSMRYLLTQGWWAGSVSGICSMCVLMINNLRDMEGDRAAGKRTFPVRFGKRAGEILMGVLIMLTPVCAWLAFENPIICLVAVPLGGLWWKVMKAEGREYNKCLMMAGICNVIYVILVGCALWAAR